MALKCFFLLLVAVIAAQNAATQNEDDFQIPVENDNQFPPDDHSEAIEGSGTGVIDEPEDLATEITQTAQIEHFDTKVSLEDTVDTSSNDAYGCPKPCVCHIEGSTNDFVIDCSGYDLTEFPSSINENATVLNIQNNKISEIPKRISSLTKLKILNANDNSIMNLAPGSISELSELVTLRLANNRLIEYPNDLKNSFGLTKLEILDLGGNDMRTSLSADIFTKFVALRTIILPSTTEELQQDLCKDLSTNLLKVCTISCETQIYECQEETSDDDIRYQLPGQLTPLEDEYDNADSPVELPKEHGNDDDNTDKESSNVSTPNDGSNGEFSFRSALNKQPSDISPLNTMVEISNYVTSSIEAAEKVGAATSDTKTGGVDKSIIGLVVAGMIVIVAVITIKKNWSSIRKRFGSNSNSNSRTPNDLVEGNANGTRPEEVPLQDKSPV